MKYMRGSRFPAHFGREENPEGQNPKRGLESSDFKAAARCEPPEVVKTARGETPMMNVGCCWLRIKTLKGETHERRPIEIAWDGQQGK